MKQKTEWNLSETHYGNIDKFLLTGIANKHDKAIMDRFHKSSEHKRKMPVAYGGSN